MSKRLLIWDKVKRVGFYPVKETWYDDLYYEGNVQNSRSPIARVLNNFRARIINKYVKGKVLDFGAGCGTLFAHRTNMVGFDICPKSIAMLKAKGVFYDYYRNDLDEDKIEGIAFFDVLEHIRDPKSVLNQINGQYIFASVPIFRGKEHALSSKHFKINEHYWYFTDYSFKALMESCGFDLLERTNEETKIGREDIGTYVFHRAKCGSCLWCTPPRIPRDKKKYGQDYMCLSLKTEKIRIKKTDIICRYYVNMDKHWDSEKQGFVPRSGD